MPSIDAITGVAKFIQPVVWIVDTSASMEGERIKLVKRILVEYKKIIKTPYLADGDIKTALLSFNTEFSWLNEDGLISSDIEIDYSSYLSPKGMTNIGMMLYELNSKLSKDGLFNESGYRRPLLLFILDGHSTDNYRSALETLKGNKWFQRSMKIGLAIGDEADVDLLSEIVGEEAIFTDPNSFVIMLEKILPSYNHIDNKPVFKDETSNEERIKPVMGENIILPSYEPIDDTSMIIEINHIEYEMHNREYKIVRCQLGACDLRTADQVCFLAKAQLDNQTVILENVDVVPETLYMMYYNLKKDESIELGVNLLDSIIISGNVQINIKSASICEIIGMSEHSVIAVSLDKGKQLVMKVGKKYEIETLTSKVCLTVNEGWSWGDEWD